MDIKTLTLSTTAAPFSRGRKIGTTFSADIARAARLYLEFFAGSGIPESAVRRIAESCHGHLTSWRPDLAEEVLGMAAGAKLPSWHVMALNARTEVLTAKPTDSGEGECSTTVFAPHGSSEQPLTLQTWDWHKALAPCGLMLHLQGKGRIESKLFTEFGMLAKIGVNSVGLGLHFNILKHASDGQQTGVPVHAIARCILEEASTVEEAISIANSAIVGASTVLTVFSSQPGGRRAACIEMTPSAKAVVEPDEEGWILHTNHFLDARLSAGERSAGIAGTYVRFDHLQSARSGMAQSDPRLRAAAICGGLGANAPVCLQGDQALPELQRWDTLLTVAVDTKGFSLQYVAGSPAELAATGHTTF